MPNSTPFFAAFGPLLFGRAPRCRLQELLGQWPQMPSLNQYMEAFGEFIPQTLLARSKAKVNSRQRIFSPLVTFWAFLAQVLERGSSCRDALQRVSAWWQVHFPAQGSPSADTSGYCQARARLDERVLQQIGTQVAEQLERQVTTQQLWLGRRVKIVDGTGLSMPDTAANQLQWPQNSEQKPGCGFPQLKVVGLFCLQSGALLQVAHDDKHHHEIILARRLWHLLQPNEILLADRGFCSYLDIAQLLGRGVDCVMRLHQGRGKQDFRRGRRLAQNDRIVVWQKPAQRPPHCSKEEYDQLPKTLTLRILRFKITVPGFRSKRSHSRHHLARSEALSGQGPGKTLFPALERRIALPTDQNHAGHGCLALPHPRDGSQRAGDASDRLQSHSRRDAACRYNLRCRLGANFLQRLSGQPPSLRRCHLCHPPQASQTGPAL